MSFSIFKLHTVTLKKNTVKLLVFTKISRGESASNITSMMMIVQMLEITGSLF